MPFSIESIECSTTDRLYVSQALRWGLELEDFSLSSGTYQSVELSIGSRRM